jgi:hypothetical protein
MRALKWLLARLDRPKAAYVIIPLALLLALPSVFSPFFVDEHLQAKKWKDWQQGTAQSQRHILNDYFVFIGSEGRERERESLGVWWMAPDLKIAFWRPLAASFADVTVSRPDAVTLRLQLDTGFFPSGSSRMFRSPALPFRQGDVVALSNMTATVVDVVKDGRPKKVEFRFASPLESPEWLWMRGTRAGLAAWTPPQVGETVVLSAAQVPARERP